MQKKQSEKKREEEERIRIRRHLFFWGVEVRGKKIWGGMICPRRSVEGEIFPKEKATSHQIRFLPRSLILTGKGRGGKRVIKTNRNKDEDGKKVPGTERQFI